MNAAAIAALSRAAVDVEVVAETGSTNADLLARASQLRRPTLLIAEHQSAGRGRAGRSWLSAPGDTLTFSLAWQFAGAPQRLLGLPLAVGVALAEALAALDVPVRLKWPNDLLKDGAKLAGILIETGGAADGDTWAVIGVGLNLLMPDQLETRIGRAAASAPWLARMDRDALMAALLDALAAALAQFGQAGFAPFRPRWDALHAWHDRPVAIVDHGAVLQHGVARGVDDSGRLLLDTAAGRVAVLAGDVSLRLGEH
ncbi:MAG: biotin--[acetyl-CoA-carboxylase] ligase [Pseudomonadota bacterium]|nr:biotin--[acetyl-CoA-carboxylase] ligase [Pseudomonadota bacterium]